jgi:DNA adenine methylase
LEVARKENLKGMENKIFVPPIKSQGIKTKLVPAINELILSSNISLDGNWIEPFFGTGVVGFNTPMKGKRIVGDTNPHIIKFYQAIQKGEIDEDSVRTYLEIANELLLQAAEDGYAYYREVKNRFNVHFDLYDFIFLSRAGFNGMMRFNRKGEWNIPFCKKKDRFSPSYITKICNQIKNIKKIISSVEWEFDCVSFEDTIAKAQKGDLIYSDSPYFGRYADFYNSWTQNDEERLYNLLTRTKAYFILSTWHHNDFRENPLIAELWSNFHVYTRDHFYHSGGKIKNRKPMVEALICNFELTHHYSDSRISC